LIFKAGAPQLKKHQNNASPQAPKFAGKTSDGIYFQYILSALKGCAVAAAAENLLLKFRAKDTPYGVTRGTIKALAAELDVTETQVIHIALSKFAGDVLPAYAPDEGPLSAKQLAALRKDAARHLPKGKTLVRQDLFA
jgi:hypothetical protein